MKKRNKKIINEAGKFITYNKDVYKNFFNKKNMEIMKNFIKEHPKITAYLLASSTLPPLLSLFYRKYLSNKLHKKLITTDPKFKDYIEQRKKEIEENKKIIRDYKEELNKKPPLERLKTKLGILLRPKKYLEYYLDNPDNLK